jgi:hypothetical protein
MPKAKTLQFTELFVLFAWKRCFLQYAENCVNASVFAAKNIANIVIFAPKAKRLRKYCGVWLPRHQNTSIYSVFCSRALKKVKTQPI